MQALFDAFHDANRDRRALTKAAFEAIAMLRSGPNEYGSPAQAVALLSEVAQQHGDAKVLLASGGQELARERLEAHVAVMTAEALIAHAA